MAASCAHCSTQGVSLKCCARCKQVSYCGAECQRVAWKGHTQTCTPPVPVAAVDDLKEVYRKVTEAASSLDFKGILKWEGRLEELVERIGRADQEDANRDCLLQIFAKVLSQTYNTNSKAHALDAVRLIERRIELLGKMQRFRDQGEAENAPPLEDHHKVLGKALRNCSVGRQFIMSEVPLHSSSLVSSTLLDDSFCRIAVPGHASTLKLSFSTCGTPFPTQ